MMIILLFVICLMQNVLFHATLNTVKVIFLRKDDGLSFCFIYILYWIGNQSTTKAMASFLNFHFIHLFFPVIALLVNNYINFFDNCWLYKKLTVENEFYCYWPPF